LGIDDHGHILDYSFCKLDKCRDIQAIPNTPYCTDITLESCKPHVADDDADDFVHIQKVGRTTFHTNGLISDNYEPFTPEVISPPIGASAIVAYSTGGNIFGRLIGLGKSICIIFYLINDLSVMYRKKG
jgi:hypothetical protein